MIKHRVKFLFVFVVVFYLIVFIVWIVFDKKFINRGKYKPSEELFFGQNIKNDVCNQELYGEPLGQNNYIKINFYCGNDKSSKNTLSLDAIEDKTVEGVIKEISRINNFELGDNFECYFEKQKVKDKRQVIVSQKTIDCLLLNMKITDIYRNENK